MARVTDAIEARTMTAELLCGGRDLATATGDPYDLQQGGACDDRRPCAVHRCLMGRFRRFLGAS